ncbi:MAG: pyrimidine-nucleoside phosphorylase [Candidatus Thermoplasmatota archaeon]
MRMVDIIKKKRDGGKLNREEIDHFVENYAREEIPDYQASALLMAVFFQDMDDEETVNLTESMIRSGETVDLSPIQGIKVDKHSTGGVGDTTTMVVAPLVASCGVPVAKISGRGLGHTGGTLDKLESIDGLSVDMSISEFIECVKKAGVAVVGATKDLAPADKRLYSLRDVTATVKNISLIASSIMSKKIAAGSDKIVLDVKRGKGAFMKKTEEARELAEAMTEIGNRMGKKTVAVVTNMDQPLGRAVGNSLEVKEAVRTLNGEGPEDLTELCLTLGSQMLMLGEAAESVSEAEEKLTSSINDGSALDSFEKMVENQGGDPRCVEDSTLLPQAEYQEEIRAERSGYVKKLNAREVGLSAAVLGAGREEKSDPIDLSAGIELEKKIGDEVAEGEKLAVVHHNDEQKFEKGKKKLKGAYEFSVKEPETDPLIYEIIG